MKNTGYYNAKVLIIENKGFSVFGMLNVELARESGLLNPAYPKNSIFRNLPGERNWYHHVILEMDGFIFDYDFGNEPLVLSKKEYFEKMFLREKRTSDASDFYVGREEKLKNYEMTILDAQAMLRAQEQRQRQPVGIKMSMGGFLAR